MTRQDKLQLQYEDAVFALLVDDAAQAEGEELLALNERLKADPDAAVPEELDKKCREAIQDAFRKKQAKSRAKSFKKVLKLSLIAVLIAATLFIVACATINMGVALVLSMEYHYSTRKDFAQTRLELYISASKAGEQYLDSLGGAATVSSEGSYRSGSFLVWQPDKRQLLQASNREASMEEQDL